MWYVVVSVALVELALFLHRLRRWHGEPRENLSSLALTLAHTCSLTFSLTLPLSHFITLSLSLPCSLLSYFICISHSLPPFLPCSLSYLISLTLSHLSLSDRK